jgi:hypothetical protein
VFVAAAKHVAREERDGDDVPLAAGDGFKLGQRQVVIDPGERRSAEQVPRERLFLPALDPREEEPPDHGVNAGAVAGRRGVVVGPVHMGGFVRLGTHGVPVNSQGGCLIVVTATVAVKTNFVFRQVRHARSRSQVAQNWSRNVRRGYTGQSS